MIVLVDGPDGTGKTGVSQYLSEVTGFPRLEMGPVDDLDHIEDKSEVFNNALVQLHEQGVDLVIDRGPVSSIVYSQVMDRDSPKNARWAIDRMKPTIVYLRCDPEELSVRYEDELLTDSEIEEIADQYDLVMEALEVDGYDVITIDTSSGAPEKAKSEVEMRL